jgi:hypothetical protein
MARDILKWYFGGRDKDAIPLIPLIPNASTTASTTASSTEEIYLD